MITKIPRKGTSVAGLLHYLSGPQRHDAEVLETNLAGDSLEDWARQIESHARNHQPRSAHLSKHLILSLAENERLSKDEWKEVVSFYLDRMGYGNAPYVAVLHRGPRRQHVHVATTPTSWDGERIRESWDWRRSEEVARQIELRWSLKPVQSSWEAREHAPSREEWRRFREQGERSARQTFQRDITQAAQSSKTISDFLSRLRLKGYSVRVQVDREGVIRGLSFGKGEHAFRGSQLGRAFKGGQLVKAFGLSYDPERDGPALRLRQVEGYEPRLPGGQGRRETAPQSLPPAEVTPRRKTGTPEIPLVDRPPRPPGAPALLKEVQRLKQAFGSDFRGEPAAAARESLHAKPRFPQAAAISSFQAEVEKARGTPELAPEWRNELSDASVIRGAYRQSAQAIRELGKPSTDPFSARAMTVILERTIEERARWAKGKLFAAEGTLEGARSRLEQAGRQAEQDPRPESLPAWRQAVKGYAEALHAQADAERAYLGWRRAQAGLDRERARAAFLRAPNADNLHDFVQHVARADRLALAEGARRDFVAERVPGMSDLSRAEIDRRWGQLATPIEQRGQRPSCGQVRELARLMRAHSRLQRGEDYAGLAERRAQLMAKRVAGGDLSPTTLRRLNTALLREGHGNALTLPSHPLPDSERAQRARLGELERAIQKDAAELARLGRGTPSGPILRLLQDGSEAVALHRALEGAEHKRLGLRAPGEPPANTARTLWHAAWLIEAKEKGLPLQQAAAHLDNLGSVAVRISRSPLGEAALGIATQALRHYARQLEQELEQSRGRGRGLSL